MTGHQINSLVGDLVAMAQAMERLPQVEAELADVRNVLVEMDKAQDSLKADLEQSRTYAASLEAKVHAAEASRDDAELRFLELDERASGAAQLLRNYKTVLDDLMLHTVEDAQSMLNPPKPQPEPIISEVKPIAADPTLIHLDQSMADANAGSASSCETAQGQSEADPTANGTTDQSVQPYSALTSVNTSSSPDWAQDKAKTTLLPPKPQPYADMRYHNWPKHVGLMDWIDGGGTEDTYYI